MKDLMLLLESLLGSGRVLPTEKAFQDEAWTSEYL